MRAYCTGILTDRRPASPTNWTSRKRIHLAMENEKLADLQANKFKLTVTCSNCNTVFETKEITCPKCKNTINTETLSTFQGPAKDKGSALHSQQSTMAMPPSNENEDKEANANVNAKPYSPSNESPPTMHTASQRDSHATALAINQTAGFKQRFFAAVIDEFILGVVVFVVSLCGLIPVGQYFLTGGGGLTNPGQIPFPYMLHLGGAFAVVILANTIPYLYIALFEASKLAATPGKWAMGLKVVSDSNSNVSLRDGISKTLTQTLLYLPIFTLIGLTILTTLSFCFSKNAASPDKDKLDYLSCILSLIAALVTTAVLSFPCFRKGTQSLTDLICKRFVVERETSSRVSVPPLQNADAAIYKLHHVTAWVFWVPLTILVTAIELAIFLWGPLKLFGDFISAIVVMVLCWIGSLWLLWKFRRQAGDLLAKAITGLLCVTLGTGMIIMAPEYITRVSNTPKVLQLMDQAIQANDRGDQKNYEKFRLQARSIPSYAIAFYIMRHDFYEKPLGMAQEAYMAPRMWGITSNPGIPAKEKPGSKEKNESSGKSLPKEE